MNYMKKIFRLLGLSNDNDRDEIDYFADQRASMQNQNKSIRNQFQCFF